LARRENEKKGKAAEGNVVTRKGTHERNIGPLEFRGLGEFRSLGIVHC